MNILIIEDEELAIEKLTNTLQTVEPTAKVVGTVTSIQASVNWLLAHPTPDIILMDIELSDGQSFEIFRLVEVKSPVIFTTSYDEYAIKAFKVNSIDYLLKPIEEEDLKAALDKYHYLEEKQISRSSAAFDVSKLIDELKTQLQPSRYRNRFLVRQGQQLISVEVTDIAYFFVEGRLTYFMTWNKHKYVVDYALEELEQMLDELQFFRANRAYLIHIRSVQRIHNYFNGKLKLQLNPGREIDDVVVSREKAVEFKEWMGK